MGELHARVVAGLDGLELIALYDPDQGKARRAAARYGGEVVGSYGALLESGIDAVSICSPTSAHLAAICEAAARGIHVLVEKPLAPGLTEGRQAAQAVAQSGIALLVGMTHHFYPELCAAKERVDRGEIGEIQLVRDHVVMPQRIFEPWKLDAEEAGGGVFMENGIHCVNRVRWILDSEVSRVSAQVGNMLPRVCGEDYGAALLVFESGAICSLTLSVTPTEMFECDLECHGTSGVLRVHSWQGYEMVTAGQRSSVVTARPDESLWDKIATGVEREAAHFLRCVRGDELPAVTAADACRDLAAVEAIYEAARTGQPVSPAPV
jgi:predicted dehydrogenase